MVERIDFGETYAPIAFLEAIRILLAYANYNDILLYQMDVKSAFLNGEIDEEVYVRQDNHLALNTLSFLTKFLG